MAGLTFVDLQNVRNAFLPSPTLADTYPCAKVFFPSFANWLFPSHLRLKRPTRLSSEYLFLSLHFYLVPQIWFCNRINIVWFVKGFLSNWCSCKLVGLIDSLFAIEECPRKCRWLHTNWFGQDAPWISWSWCQIWEVSQPTTNLLSKLSCVRKRQPKAVSAIAVGGATTSISTTLQTTLTIPTSYSFQIKRLSSTRAISLKIKTTSLLRDSTPKINYD